VEKRKEEKRSGDDVDKGLGGDKEETTENTAGRREWLERCIRIVWSDQRWDV
jgi:hypothetical protein